MSISQQEITDSLPAHLRPFVAHQDYSRYTARDHAVWRFLLHQLRDNLSQTSHPVYLEGLQRTGISLESIPRIEAMNDCLAELGWRAVVVDGFVPPAIFMEFQAHRVLVIAVDMRSYEHMLYTPAPDIVHESAGHAPFIVDTDYAEYLQRFGELGMRAISSKGDFAVYEAIRHLSIIKETVNASAVAIQSAEQALEAAIRANKQPSEAALLARLHWWTVEYGLVGTVHDYRIFGAGLLSSLGESVNCLDDQRVKKIPLTVNAISAEYDITTEQPHLFVARNCRHLSQVLEEFGRQMCVNRGGAAALQTAIDAATVNTAVTHAGVEISGRFCQQFKDAIGNVSYIKTTGPTQLAYAGEQLPGHGIEVHHNGFSSPVGRVQALDRCLSSYTVDELKERGIQEGKTVTLAFLSGITLTGLLQRIVRREHKNLLFTFASCSVTNLNGEVLFDPGAGSYSMAIGESIDSVYGGSADQEAFPLYKNPAAERTAEPEYDQQTLELFAYYRRLRELRESGSVDKAQLKTLADQIDRLSIEQWLLDFELLELLLKNAYDAGYCQCLTEKLQRAAGQGSAEQCRLITYGLQRLYGAEFIGQEESGTATLKSLLK